MLVLSLVVGLCGLRGTVQLLCTSVVTFAVTAGLFSQICLCLSSTGEAASDHTRPVGPDRGAGNGAVHVSGDFGTPCMDSLLLIIALRVLRTAVCEYRTTLTERSLARVDANRERRLYVLR